MSNNPPSHPMMMAPPFGFPPGGPPSDMPFIPPPGGMMPPPSALPNIPPGSATMSGESVWTEHRSPDERIYYYNRLTKQSTWEKPEELKTESEKILAACPWKEFKTDAGRIYFYNSQTKQSVWSKPTDLLEAEKQAEVSSNKGSAGCAGSEGASSAIEEAMKATLASIELPPAPTNSDAAAAPNAASAANASITKSVDSSSGEESDSEEDDDKEDEKSESNKMKSASTNTPAKPAPPKYQFKTRVEKTEGFRQLLIDKNVPANASWETAVKLIMTDVRYPLLKHFNEKKQVFNIYKTQKLKEDKEEQRLKAKKAKEDLEELLFKHPKITSMISYRKAESIFASEPRWSAVNDRDKRDLYTDVIKEKAKREAEDARLLRKRNKEVFNEILDVMPDLTYKTTWTEAQQMLLDNPRFAEDEDLQNMDKEDALMCFEEHIRQLESEYEEEKEKERKRQRRIQRKNREALIVFFDELHDKGVLNSLSLWKNLYIIISRDERFHGMLSQPGSTPLDLFKFYVEELKERFPEHKRITKDILKDRSFQVDTKTTWENFLQVINMDERGRALDSGNVRMAYCSLVEKATSREKEQQREEARKQKKLERSFKDMLQSADPPVVSLQPWETIVERFGKASAFTAITLESERMRVFKDYLLEIEDTNSASYSDQKKKRKKDVKTKRGRSREHSRERVAEKEKEKEHHQTTSDNKRASTERETVVSKTHHVKPIVHQTESENEKSMDNDNDDSKSDRKKKRKDKKVKKDKKKKHKSDHKKKKKRKLSGNVSDGEVSESLKRRKSSEVGSDSDTELTENELERKKQRLLAELEG